MTDSDDRARPRLRAHRILPAALGLGMAGGHAVAAPIAVDDTFDVVSRAATTVVGNVLTNDSGNGLTAVPNTVFLGAGAAASLAGNGDLTVTISDVYPSFNACNASDRSFGYQATDSSLGLANAVVNLHFIPALVDDSYTVPAGQASSEVLNANDNYTSGVSYYLASNASHGSVSLDSATSAFVYTPAPGFSGQDAFSYQASGGGVCNAITTVLLNVAPVAVDDSYLAQADTPLGGNVLGNDLGNGLSVVSFSAPAHGSLGAGVAPDGSFVYTPDPAYHGSDAFTYAVVDAGGGNAMASVLLSVNAPPTALDDVASTAAGQSVSGNVLTNDSDPDSDPLTAVLIAPPVHGSLSGGLGSSGSYTYVPAAGYSGTDSAGYAIDDGRGGNATAILHISVLPVAAPDSYATPYATALAANVLANDLGSGLVASVVTGPQHGSLALNPDGSFTYMPTAGYSGSDGFTYAVQDASGQNATATVTLSVGNGAPVANPDSYTGVAGQTLAGNVLANDTDPNNDPLTVTTAGGATHGSASISPSGALSYTPAAGYSGPDQLSYAISDGQGGSANGVASILITPYAGADSFGAGYGSAITGNVLANDLGSSLVASVVTGPQHGSLALNPDGSFTYTPASGYSGSDGFDYRVTDAYGSSTVAHVSLAVGAAPMPVPTLDRGALGLLGGLLAWLGLRRRPRRA